MKANPGAEMSALGSIIVDPTKAEAVFDLVTPQMFADPKHADLASVLQDMAAAGQSIDPQLVLSELTGRGLADKIGGAVYLHTLMERAWDPMNAARHAEDVRNAYRHRHLAEVCERALQQTENPDPDLSLALGMLQVGVAEVEDMAVTRKVEPAPYITDVLIGEDRYDWLIPGLLERGERFMLTGAEGGGKSVCLRQIAACAAAGLHPFTAEHTDPVSVLVVDCENSRRQNRRGYRPIVETAQRIRSDVDWSRLRIAHRPEGLDLTQPGDAAWLDGIVQASSPDLLVIGPLYRLHEQNINDELAARKLVALLDTIRVRHHCSMLIEAHAGHAEDGARRRKMRPTGSSLFLRWPEFGYGLRRSELDTGETKIPLIVDVVAWRGAREDRAWPTHLKRGNPDSMPWLAYDPDDPINIAQRQAEREINGHRKGRTA